MISAPSRAHEDRLLRGWSQVGSYDRVHSPAESFFPLALRNELPAIEAELSGLARLCSEHPAGKGVARLLVELNDGQMVESVLLPRGGLCVSTQVGCAVGCVFCMSGRAGLLRQLGSAEIVAQVVLGAQAPRGEQGGVHGHGRTGAQSRQRARSDPVARHTGKYRSQESGVIYGGRFAGV